MILLTYFALAASVVAAPASETPRHRIAVISDMNGSYGSTRYGSDVHRAVERLVELKPEVVLATGDLVAGQKAGLDYRAMWESFHRTVTIPLRDAGIPLAVTVGNHDGSAYPRFDEERRIFSEEWKSHLPDVKFVDLEEYPFFYSFASEQHLYISLDSTRVGPQSPKRLAWLDRQLRVHGIGKTIVMFTHVPLFHFADIPEGESYFDERLLEIIERFGVRLYLTGHHHSYFPGVYRGTHFVSQACLGSGPTKLKGTNQVSSKSFTVIDFYEDRFEVYALKAPLFLEKIDVRSLPGTLESRGRILKREEMGIFREPHFLRFEL
jgi:Icc-related predicted phosphoesterase